VLKFWSLDNSSSKSILDVLEKIYLKFRKTIVQRVTVVKLGVYNGGGNCFGGSERTNVQASYIVTCSMLCNRYVIQTGNVMRKL